MIAMIVELNEQNCDLSYHVVVVHSDGCLRKIPGNNGWKTHDWAKAELAARNKSGNFVTPNVKLK